MSKFFSNLTTNVLSYIYSDSTENLQQNGNGQTILNNVIDSVIDNVITDNKINLLKTCLKDSKKPPGIKVIVISDTHSRHNSIPFDLQDSDILIHAGDFTNTGTKNEIKDFTEWFDSLTIHKNKIFIAGNHDTSLDKEYYINKGAKRFHRQLKDYDINFIKEYADECIDIVNNTKSCIYLKDSSINLQFPINEEKKESELDGDEEVNSKIIKEEEKDENIDNNKILKEEHLQINDNTFNCTVYGSPWQPEFCDWAFNVTRGHECLEKWNLIPESVDILITHGPSYGYGDKTFMGTSCGCEDLMNKIKSRKKPPRIHIFGHIHEGYGAWSDGNTLFVNGSTCTFRYRPINKPIIIHLPYDINLPASIIDNNYYSDDS